MEAERDAGGYFHVVSKDTGFDPLIAHLKAKGLQAKRSASLDGVPPLRGLTEAKDDDQVGAVIENLRKVPKNRPQKERTLRATVSNWFGSKLDDAALDAQCPADD